MPMPGAKGEGRSEGERVDGDMMCMRRLKRTRRQRRETAAKPEMQ